MTLIGNTKLKAATVDPKNIITISNGNRGENATRIWKNPIFTLSNEDLQGDQIHLIMNAIDVARKFKWWK